MKIKTFAKFRIFLLGLALAVIVGVGWFLLEPGALSKDIRHILLISIDTCRADYLSCYGFGRKTTPTIDAIAQESILFKNALTPIPLTLPAHSSMLTGTSPLYHKVHDNLDYQLGESNVTLAEILGVHGYTTGAIVSTYILDTKFGVSQGFDSYNDKFEQTIGPHEKKERLGIEASRFACSYLEEHRDEPFFLFLHYFDPHTKYAPPEPFASEYSDDLYSGEIAYTDHCIAQVIEKLKSLDLYDSSLIIIVGDHGEMLGEHGESEHGYYIYQSAMRVPFIIRPPGWRKATKIDDVVSLVDVFPTILSYLEIPVPAHVQGKDLSVYSRGKPPSAPKRHVYIESLIATKYGCNPLLGVVSERWKYIATTRPELYDLYQRPLEANNLVEKEAQRARFMQGQLQEMIAELTGAELTGSRLVMDEETRKRFESLGYVGGSTVDESFRLDPTKKDPKDLIQYHDYRQRVIYLVYYQQYDEARAICEKMLAEWPEVPYTYFELGRITFEKGELAESIVYNTKFLAMVSQPGVKHPESSAFDSNRLAHRMLGRAYYQLEQYDKAVEHFSALLGSKIEQLAVHGNLAVAFFKLGKIDQAVKHWTEVLRLKPDWPEVHNNLATAFYKKGKTDEAIKHWAEALRLNPHYAEAHVNLGSALKAQGKFDEAVSHFRQALQVRPNSAEALNNLGSVLAAQGRFDEAVNYFNQALQIKPDYPGARNNREKAQAQLRRQSSGKK